MGRALQPADGAAGRLRTGRRRGRRRDDRRRQYRRLYPHHDDGDIVGDLQGQSAAGDGTGAHPCRHRSRDQRGGMGDARLVRTAGGLMMRAPSSDLPLVLDDVSLRVGATTILNRLSLSITPGAPTLIVGPNGAGKTTLLRLCMGLDAPSAGRITWGGRANCAPLRRAILFQRPVMLRRTTAANVGYGLAQAGTPRRLRAQRVAALLERVGLSDLAQRPARRLSGGGQQRLGVGAGRARVPETMVLDEPTANLDPAATRGVEGIVLVAGA